MSRRTAASLTALGLLIALIWYGGTRQVDFVTFKPGPTVDVLGDGLDGKDLIQITGHPVYRDKGSLRMVTVLQSRPETRMTLTEMLYGWMNPDIAVLPREAVFPDEKITDKQIQQQSAAEMTSSQDSATAAALSAADIGYRTRVLVSGVVKDGPSDGKLEKGDVILTVDSAPVTTTAALVERVRGRTPGDTVTLGVRRNGKDLSVPVVTTAAKDDPRSARIGVDVGTDHVFPFEVRINLDEKIGGPSAGMMFALTIYDLLTPGSLTGGSVIAGSGEISSEGVIGPIGGIGQKIAAAQRDGARLFLVAQENCAEAVRAHYDEDKIQLVKVHTLDEAIEGVEAWTEDRDADLPECA